jgi:hypothetical protein
MNENYMKRRRIKYAKEGTKNTKCCSFKMFVMFRCFKNVKCTRILISLGKYTLGYPMDLRLYPGVP